MHRPCAGSQQPCSSGGCDIRHTLAGTVTGCRKLAWGGWLGSKTGSSGDSSSMVKRGLTRPPAGLATHPPTHLPPRPRPAMAASAPAPPPARAAAPVRHCTGAARRAARAWHTPAAGPPRAAAAMPLHPPHPLVLLLMMLMHAPPVARSGACGQTACRAAAELRRSPSRCHCHFHCRGRRRRRRRHRRRRCLPHWLLPLAAKCSQPPSPATGTCPGSSLLSGSPVPCTWLPAWLSVPPTPSVVAGSSLPSRRRPAPGAPGMPGSCSKRGGMAELSCCAACGLVDGGQGCRR